MLVSFAPAPPPELSRTSPPPAAFFGVATEGTRVVTSASALVRDQRLKKPAS